MRGFMPGTTQRAQEVTQAVLLSATRAKQPPHLEAAGGGPARGGPYLCSCKRTTPAANWYPRVYRRRGGMNASRRTRAFPLARCVVPSRLRPAISKLGGANFV